jgi:transposase-like protein
MGQLRRVFTPKFKQEALKLVTVGWHPTAQVARDLGITPNLLRRWKQEITGDPIAAFSGKKRRKPHAGVGPCDARAGFSKRYGGSGATSSWRASPAASTALSN